MKQIKKALVTGGLGFIGSHLVRELYVKGWTVTIVDDFSAGTPYNLADKEVEYRVVLPSMIRQFRDQLPDFNDVLVLNGDFAHRQVLRELVTGDYTHVFHLAANPRVEYSVEHPVETTETNVMKTVKLLDACRKANLERFVFASSSSVYGDHDSTWYDERDACEPVSPYGLQKLVCEQFIKLYANLYDFPTVALRFFNVYGPARADGTKYMTAITAWVDAIATGKPLRLDGDGTQTRDLVYVDDVVGTMIAVAIRKSPPRFTCLNVGTGQSVSSNEILKILKKHCPGIIINKSPPRRGDVKHTCAGTIRLRNVWDVKTTVEQGLEKILKLKGLI